MTGDFDGFPNQATDSKLFIFGRNVRKWNVKFRQFELDISRSTATSWEIYYSMIVDRGIMPLVVIKPICTSDPMHQKKFHYFSV